MVYYYKPNNLSTPRDGRKESDKNSPSSVADDDDCAAIANVLCPSAHYYSHNMHHHRGLSCCVVVVKILRIRGLMMYQELVVGGKGESETAIVPLAKDGHMYTSSSSFQVPSCWVATTAAMNHECQSAHIIHPPFPNTSPTSNSDIGRQLMTS